ncbi:TetR/AcrR family transcriptional regulator [Radicibacter daui]|uniref:TetR/AcrR family transcriptional regulator n=1 Tax=Radicibacter daui TaxID=3064829 RepID=UPI004046D270
MAKGELSTRERIVEAAGKLFYGEGIRAVSLDAVAEKAGVTKRTFYYHFRSKDDLVAAYLEARDQPNLALFQRWFAVAEGDLPARVEGIFQNLARSARHPKWKGCGFLRTSVELVNLPGHPAMVAGRAHKKRVESWLSEMLEPEVGTGAAEPLAQQLILLMDGAFSVQLLHRDAAYIEVAGQAAANLVRAAITAAEGRL